MKTSKLISLIFASILIITACGKDDEGGGADLPDISIGSLEVFEGNDDQTVSVIVNIAGTHSGTVSVNYSTTDITATSGSDYETADGTLNFDAGDTQKTISIVIKGDEDEESDESFELQLSNPTNVNLLNSKSVITIINDDSASGNPFGIPTTGYETPESYPGMTLVWQDEFQGSSLDLTCWNFEIGNGNNGWGNNELEYYKSENTSIVLNDYLMIEAKQENQSGFNYTSSRLTTQGKKSYKYGRVDIRAALPQGKGIWPALWMLGDNFATVGWPSCGEIDIMEMVGGNGNDDTVHGTVHWDNAGSHASYGNSYSLAGANFAEEFHVFSIVWDSEKIIWYVDDIQYNVIDTTPAGLSEFQESFFFIFNVAVGGNWPGSPDASTVFPQRMAVDYIRVFQ